MSDKKIYSGDEVVHNTNRVVKTIYGPSIITAPVDDSNAYIAPSSASPIITTPEIVANTEGFIPPKSDISAVTPHVGLAGPSGAKGATHKSQCRNESQCWSRPHRAGPPGN